MEHVWGACYLRGARHLHCTLGCAAPPHGLAVSCRPLVTASASAGGRTAVRWPWHVTFPLRHLLGSRGPVAAPPSQQGPLLLSVP